MKKKIGKGFYKRSGVKRKILMEHYKSSLIGAKSEFRVVVLFRRERK